ncbi:alpha/beta hydrolase [bacterium]|nr:alpha/beta hydrolase [bacterium]
MQLSISGKTVEIFTKTNSINKIPSVILHTFQGEGKEVFEKCAELGCDNFALTAIGNLNWNHDLSPWPAPTIGNNKYGFGGAEGYIKKLTNEIIPEIRAKLGFEPEFTAIAGYSLAGLFALYAAYRTDIFSRIASVSGSLWFPGFTEFAETNKFVKTPDLIYLSLGEAEAKTRDKNLAPVRKNTEKLDEIYKTQNIPTIFELNPGNHFTETVLRTAKGIKSLLD